MRKEALTLPLLAATTGLQLLALTAPAPADTFYMALGAAFFTLPYTLLLLRPQAQKRLLVSAFLTTAYVGLRLDALPARCLLGLIFVYLAVSACRAHLAQRRGGAEG